MPVLSDFLHSFGERILTTLDAQAKKYAKKGQKKSRKFKVYGVHFLLPPFIFRDRFSCESIITHIARQCKHFLTFHVFIFFGLNKPGKLIVKKGESPHLRLRFACPIATLCGNCRSPSPSGVGHPPSRRSKGDTSGAFAPMKKQSLSLLRRSDIVPSGQLYFSLTREVILYSPPNCAKRNITRRKPNITATQYHSRSEYN